MGEGGGGGGGEAQSVKLGWQMLFQYLAEINFIYNRTLYKQKH